MQIDFCPRCGSPVQGLRFCGRCGVDLYPQAGLGQGQGPQTVIAKKPQWVMTCKIVGTLLSAIGMLIGIASCGSSGNGAGVGGLMFLVGLVVFIVGRFGD